GFVRQEIAYGLDDNPNNLMSSPFNDRITPQTTSAAFNAANAAANSSVYDNPGPFRGGLFASGALNAEGFLPAGHFTTSPVDCYFGMQRAIAAGSAGFGPRILSDGAATFPGTFCANGGGTAYVPGVNPAAGQGITPAGDFSLQGDDDINFNMFNTRVEVDVQ